MGDERERFGLLFESHSRAVLGYVLRRTEDREDAADVVAEVFLVAWRRLGDVPADPASARLWMYATARNVMANQRRSAARRSRVAEAIGRHIPVSVSETGSGAARVVEEAMDALGDDDRELVRLSSWEQLSPTEIATVLGVAPGVVRTRLHRARQRLAAELHARGWNANGVTERSSQ